MHKRSNFDCVCTFGFKPCVFDLRQLDQKTSFEINIDVQMYVEQNTTTPLRIAICTFGFKHLFQRLVFDQVGASQKHKV
jgi:hypothetical protein